MKVFDIVSAVVLEERENNKELQFNEESFSILKQYCEMLDILVEDGYGNQIQAGVVGKKKYIKIAIDVMDVTYETKFKPRAYVEIIRRAIAMKFSSAGEDTVHCEFLFPSLWNTQAK